MQNSGTLTVKKPVILDNMRYIPSPINFSYDLVYCAVANRTGRMQYFRIIPGVSRERINRAEFLDTFNNQKILGIKPLQTTAGPSLFQMEFYI